MAAVTWQKFLDMVRERTEGRSDDEIAQKHYTTTPSMEEPSTSEQRDLLVMDEKNREVFKRLMTRWRRAGLEEQEEAEPGKWYTQANFFRDVTDKLVIQEKFATGGQAELYSALYGDTVHGPLGGCILKVFKRTFDLETHEKDWPEALLVAKSIAYKSQNSQDDRTEHDRTEHDRTEEDRKMAEFRERCCRVWCGTLLREVKEDREGIFVIPDHKQFDGRFAFLIDKYWGDLRTLINFQMSDKNLDFPPFEDSLAISLILQIAKGMQSLHALNVLHRDLKAANVLLRATGLIVYGIGHNSHPEYHDSMCLIADYESSAQTYGTEAWNAPEVQDAINIHRVTRKLIPAEVFTESSDVYSYGITCYEVLTGIQPKESDVQYVRSGGLPFPECIPADLQELVKECWDGNPSKRPTVEDIVKRVEKIQEVHGQKKEPSAERRKRIENFRNCKQTWK